MRGLKPLTGIILLTLAFSNAWAATDEEIFRDFRFNFINPGARSLGLGGAFIGAADDATAIVANPAALHYVSRFEVFLEYRSIEKLSRSTGPTQMFGDPSLPPTPDPAVDFFDFETLFSADKQNIPSFVSFAAPFRIKIAGKPRRARLAISRQVVLDQENVIGGVDPGVFRQESDPTPSPCAGFGASCTSFDYSLTNFPVAINDSDPMNPFTQRALVTSEVTGRLDAEIIHYDLGFAMSVAKDFSVGLTATLADLTVKSDVTNVTFDPAGVVSSVHPRVDIDGAKSDIRTATSIDGSDSALTFTVGLHWHPDSFFPSGLSPLRMGVVYRKGADLSVPQTSFEFNPLTATFEANAPFDNTFNVPDRWGVGAAWVGRHWKYSFDIERVLYSDQLEGFKVGENFFTQPGRIPGLNLDPNDLEFTVDDATVPHAGVEYSFTSGGGKWTQAVRVGYYLEPDNRIRLDRIDDPSVPADRRDFFLDLFRGGEDLDHFTVGFSVGTPIGLELQFAGDFSDSNDVLLGSAIVRFGSRR